MPDLTIAIDPGSIGTKGFVTLKSFKPELLLMEPEVAEVSQQSLENYEETSLGNPKPENAAWIEYKGEYRAIGFLARDRFYAELNLNQPKLKLALYKTLALLGTIAQKKGLANGASARVGILFPYGEYRDGKLFKEMLTEAVTSFRFRGEERSFELDSYVCRPEGFGVIARGRAPGNSLKDAVIVVIVIGYRDASVYIMNRGIITKGNTAELGFNKFIEIVRVHAPNQNALRLAAAICKAGAKISPKALLHLARFSDPDLRDAELTRIRVAIATAREQYWLMLSNWLRNFIPVDLSEVIIAGGTARYYEREFTAMFPHLTINWGAELEEQVERCFHAKVAENSLNFRLTDAYGFFYYLCANDPILERVANDIRGNG